MKLKKVLIALGLFATVFSSLSLSPVSAKSGWADNHFSAQPLLINQVHFGYLDPGGDVDWYSYYNNSYDLQTVGVGANPYSSNSLNYNVVVHVLDKTGNITFSHAIPDKGPGVGEWIAVTLEPGFKAVWAISAASPSDTGVHNEYRTRVRLY